MVILASNYLTCAVTVLIYVILGNWKLSHIYPIPKQSLESREIQLNGDEKKQFLEFMRKMLQWIPEDRADAQHLLFEDPWVRGGDY